MRGALRICGPVDEAEAAELCRRAHAQLDAGVTELVVEATGRIDLSVVEVLARLRLLTCRRAVTLRLRPVAAGAAAPELQALLDFAGLDDLTDPWESC